MHNVKIYAHRGNHIIYTENTLEAVKSAINLPIDGVEIDVRCTADGQAVLMHDAELSRVTDVHAKLKSLKLNELKNIKTHCGQPIAALDEVLSLFTEDKLLNIECKTVEAADASIALIKSKKVTTHCLISSFIPEALALAHQKLPTLETALIAEDDFYDNLERATALKCSALHFCGSKLSEQNIVDSKATKIRLVAWTINDINLAKKLHAFGIDGIITDFPQKMLGHKIV